ncbi:MAG: hypothetical protein ACI9WU_001305 [Myxococcota bacterium]
MADGEEGVTNMLWISGISAVLLCTTIAVKGVQWWMGEKQARKLQTHRRRLMQRYGPVPVVDAILAGDIMRGMNSAMVTDALGPADHETLIDPERFSWQYDPTRSHPVAMHVHFNCGHVISWHSGPALDVAA